MPITLSSIDNDLITVKISGKLQQPEFDGIQKAAASAFRDGRHFRVLALLEDFLGWDNSGNWEDCSFRVENDEFMEKIAIVGDKKWEDLALMFTGQGFRSVEIEFFEPTNLPRAIAWLSDNAAPGPG